MTEMIAWSTDELGKFWSKEVYPFVKPIVEVDYKGRTTPVGSGVLASVGEKHCLVTAAHVTEKACVVNEGIVLYTFAPEQLEIKGVNNFFDDPFDLSMTEIPVALRQCLRLPQDFTLRTVEGELCLVLGFPARSKSWEFNQHERTLRPAPFSYLGKVFRRSPGRFSVKYSSELIGRRGKLNGISGGGAFVLRRDRPRLAGIVIEYHAASAEIVCTDSLAIWSMAKRLTETNCGASRA